MELSDELDDDLFPKEEEEEECLTHTRRRSKTKLDS